MAKDKKIARILSVVWAALVSAFFVFIISSPSAKAATGINSQLSFEGKIVRADGTNINSGTSTYNMEFKIYQDGTNTGSGSTLKWTEDWLVGGSGGVSITDGTFQVNLGAHNPFASQVDWNQDTLWLSLQVGNTSSCTISTDFHTDCSGDGEMSPYIRLTSVPYAQNANSLQGINASGFIQNNTVQQASSNFNISGTGIAGAALQAPSFDVASSGALSIGTGSNATAINIGQSTSNVTTTVNGLFVSKPTSGNDSPTAFQIQSANGTKLFNADTTNMRLGVNVTYTAMTVPSGLTSVASAGTGFTAGQSYLYEVTAIDSAGGETTVSNEPTACAPASTNLQCTLAWTAVTGASGYKVYRTANGGTTGTEKYLTTVLTNSYIDANTITLSSTSAPGSNTAYTSANNSGSLLQLSVGGLGTPTGQVYVGGILPKDISGGGVPTQATPSGLYASGRYVYVVSATGNKLQIFDVSNPSRPVDVSGGGATTASGPQNVAVSGHYAYVTACTDSKLQVFDISNPFAPTDISSGGISAQNCPNFIYVSGRYAYVTSNGASRLEIFDISNPAAPVEISNISAPTSTWGVYVSGRYAYVVGNTKLQIYDVSKPASPVDVTSGGVTTATNANGMTVVGRYVYLATNGSSSHKIQIFDVANPASPIDVTSGGLDTGVRYNSIQVVGRYAYATSRLSNKLQVIDVSNPTKPIDVSGGGVAADAPLAIAVSGRYAYTVSPTNSKLQAFDLGGAYLQQLEAGSTETGTLQVDSNSLFFGDANIQGGLQVGQGIQSAGNLGISGGAFVQGSTVLGGGSNLLGPPSGTPSVSFTGTPGGSAVTWSYVVTAVNASGGESTASSTGSIASPGSSNSTLSSSNHNDIGWSAVSGATSYKIYRTAATGGTPSTTGSIGTTTSTSFSDTGIIASGNSAPSINTTGQLTVEGSVNIQQAASLSAGQNQITQTLTNGSSTGGTVQGYNQTITVNNTSSASTTNGINIAITDATTLANTTAGINSMVTDNGASGAKTNKAVAGMAGGTNTSAINYGGYFSLSGGASSSAALFATNGTSTGNILQLQDGSTPANVLTVADEGAVTFANSTNSVTAFQIQNSSGVSLENLSTISSVRNLIWNPGFESNTYGWLPYGFVGGVDTLSATTTSAAVQSGTQGMQDVTTASTNRGIRFPYAFRPSTTYSFSIYAAVSSGTTGAFLDIGRYENGAAVTTSCPTTQTLTTTLTKFTCTFTTGSSINASQDGPFVRYTDASNAYTFYFDTAQLELGSSATSFVDQLYPNLISNSNFEGAANGWSVKGGSTISSSDDSAYFNSRSLKIVTAGGANDGVSYTVQLRASSRYTLNFWAKSSSGSYNITPGRQDISGTDADCSAVAVSTTWGQYTCTFTTGGTITNPTSIYFKDSVAHTTYVDGVTLVASGVALSYNPGGANLQVDPLYNNIGLNNSNIGEIQPWQTSSNSLPSAVIDNQSIIANGYIYSVGGTNSTAVYYAKLNADGSMATWQTGNNLPARRDGGRAVSANGYLYYLGGNNGTSDQASVFYAKLNSDGSIGAWQTNANVLPAASKDRNSFTAGGYIYYLRSSGSTATLYYATLNSDGSTGIWRTSPNTIAADINGLGSAGVIVINGYVYVVGGLTGSLSDLQSVYYAKLNADGSIGSWQLNANNLSGRRSYQGMVTANGYIYSIAGRYSSSTPQGTSSTYYAKVNTDGSIGTWQTSNSPTPDLRLTAGSAYNNGYFYLVGGNNGFGVAQATVYYTSASRVTVGGNLDLVGLGGLSQGDVGGGGGNLTAADIVAVGSLQVQGPSSFSQDVTIDKNLRVGGSATFRNTSDSLNSLTVQNASGVNLLNISTVNVVKNSNFEYGTTSINDGVEGWTRKGAAGIAIQLDNSTSVFGSNSMKFITTALAQDGVKYPIVLKPSTQYMFSFYGKLSASSIATLAAGRSDDGSTDTPCTLNSNTIDTTFTRFNCTFTTGASITSNSTYIYISQGTTNVSTTFFIDGVQLEAGGSLTGYRNSDISLDGLVTLQAATMVASQNQIAQTLTNGSSTGGTVDGYKQTITVSPTGSASTTNGIEIALTDATTLANNTNGVSATVTDNGASGAKTNTAFKATGAGSNSSQIQYIIDSSANHGIAVRGASTGSGGSVTCGPTTAAYSIGVCGTSSLATSSGYGGYFAATGNGGTALFATNGTSTANIFQLQDGTSPTNVLTVADVGLITVQPAASLTSGQTNIAQTLTNGSSTGGTVDGYKQTITVSPTGSASTTNGIEIALTDATTLANNTNGVSATVTDNGASGAKTNKAIVGTAGGSNTSAISYGGYFTLSGGAATSSALYASNGSTTGNIAQFQDNASDVMKIADGGAITITPTQDVVGLVIKQTSASTPSSDIFNIQNAGSAMQIQITSSGAINIGSSSSGNYTAFDSATRELTLNGTARHTRRMSLTPEYPGATMTGTGIGTMTSDNETASPFHNYYKWTTTQGTSQTYSVWVRVPLPMDFSAWCSSANCNPTIFLYTKNSGSSASSVQLATYDTANASVQALTNIASANTSWNENSVNASPSAQTWTAGGYMTLQIQMSAISSSTTQIGELRMDYLSKW